MKKLGVILLGGIGVLCSTTTWSQSLEELSLLFSRTNTPGSARILGLGGAQTSLGGDFSSASSNPAGLGMFNRSEFTISPTLSVVNSKAAYFGDTTNEFKTKLSIPSISYAFNMKRDNGSWLGGTVAITLTRLNDFNSTIRYEGINPNNSIGDYFAIDSDGINPADFDGSQYNTLNRLAYNTYFIDTLNFDNFLYYISPVGINFFDESDVPRSFQTETIEYSGKQNQWSVSYGTNFSDRFFFGAGLHIRTITYSNKKTYSESGYFFEAFPSYDPLDEFYLEENLRVSGSGFSGTIGSIVRPVDGLQVGVSYNLPTTYFLSESYTAYMSADWNNFDYYGDGGVVLDGIYDDQIDELINEYKLKTPGKVSAGVTYFFKKLGFVSADVDAVDYSGGTYKPRLAGDSYDSENASVDTLYKRVVNFRVGGEFRLRNLRLRSGFGLLSDPYVIKKNDAYSGVFSYSLGIGYRAPKFYADAALVIRTRSDFYNPYTTYGYSVNPEVSVKTFAPSLNFTVGFPL